MKNGRVERFEFPKLPHSQFLSYEQREQFLDSVDRSSAKTKVESLVTASEQLITEMESEYMFRQEMLRVECLKTQAKYFELHKNSAFVMSLLLNLLILLSFHE